MKTKKLRAYYWQECEDAETGIGVVAYNIKEAASLARSWYGFEVGFNEPFTEHRICWQKNVDLSKLKDKSPHPIDDWVEGLKIGIYSFIEGECDCEKCFKTMDGACSENVFEDKLICNDCLEELNR